MVGDGMRQGDGMNFSLECAHPNTAPGQRCEICGKWIPLQENKDNAIRKSIQEDSST